MKGIVQTAVITNGNVTKSVVTEADFDVWIWQHPYNESLMVVIHATDEIDAHTKLFDALTEHLGSKELAEDALTLTAANLVLVEFDKNGVAIIDERDMRS